MTRPLSPKDLKINKMWLHGPEFLKGSIEEWPIYNGSTADSLELPDHIGIILSCKIEEERNHMQCKNLSCFDLSRYSNCSKLIKVTSMVLSVVRNKSFKGAGIVSSVHMQNAEFEWLKFVQNEIPNDWMKRFKRLGPIRNKEGLICVGERMANWLKMNWNQDLFILLPTKSRFSYLQVLQIHNKDHGDLESTLAKVRCRFWIPGVTKIIKTLRASCVPCRKKNKKLSGQVMGQLPAERLQPSPPFYNTAVDLFGPFMIKDTIKKRCKTKVYGVIFNCLSCRAIYIDLSEGYDTSSFIMVLRRFVAIREYPKIMRTDNGSHLIASSKGN